MGSIRHWLGSPVITIIIIHLLWVESGILVAIDISLEIELDTP